MSFVSVHYFNDAAISAVDWTISVSCRKSWDISEACHSLRNMSQIIPIPAADLPFVIFFGSDLAKMKNFRWSGSFLVDRLVSLSAAGYEDVIAIRTSRVFLREGMELFFLPS